MTDTVRAVVLDEPGPVTNLHIRELPVPEPDAGWLRIRVEAFGPDHVLPGHETDQTRAGTFRRLIARSLPGCR